MNWNAAGRRYYHTAQWHFIYLWSGMCWRKKKDWDPGSECVLPLGTSSFYILSCRGRSRVYILLADRIAIVPTVVVIVIIFVGTLFVSASVFRRSRKAPGKTYMGNVSFSLGKWKRTESREQANLLVWRENKTKGVLWTTEKQLHAEAGSIKTVVTVGGLGKVKQSAHL